MTVSQILLTFIVAGILFSAANLWQGYRQKKSSKGVPALLSIELTALVVSTLFLLPAKITAAQSLAGIAVLLLWFGSFLYALANARSWSPEY